MIYVQWRHMENAESVMRWALLLRKSLFVHGAASESEDRGGNISA